MKLTGRGIARALPMVVAFSLGLGGCAFVPKEYPRLEEAHALGAHAHSDASVARLAAAELRQADAALERARAARDTLDDPAVVEHLAYVARQRVAIAREAAAMRAARETIR